MEDRALQNALSRRDALRQQLQDLKRQVDVVEGEIRQADYFIRLWQGYADGSFKVAVTPSDKSTGVASPVSRARPQSPGNIAKKKVWSPSVNPKKEVVAEVARQLILEKGMPVPRRELYELLKARGIEIVGSPGVTVMSTMLWRMRDRVRYLDRVGYWLPEKPWPPSDRTNAGEEGDDPASPNHINAP